jgi:cytochrome c peroxidase
MCARSSKSLLISALTGSMVLTSAAAAQQSPQPSLAAPQQCSRQINIQSFVPGGSRRDPDVLRENAEIDAVFAAGLRLARDPASLDPYHRVTLLGTLALYDRNLSVNKNLACTSCHTRDTGFTGGVSLWNQTIVAQPGSVRNTVATSPAPNYRISARKPQSYGYAPFSPILQYDEAQQQFTGGNFWDMRATGFRLSNPAAEQAQGPPTNPVEMGMPDSACIVYRLSQSGYRGLFEQVWGGQSFAIRWPANVATACSTPGPPPPGNPLPVSLSPVDRGISNGTYDHLALSIAADEASPDVSPFSSKFDDAVNHPQQSVLSAEELAGRELFRGKGKCNTCHLDGTQNTAAASASSAQANPRTGLSGTANTGPLFTDFQAHNLGVPANPALPFYCESTPDQQGYVANPSGTGFVDHGIGGFLASGSNPNREWAKYEQQFQGRFQTATVRNIDKRPYPDFVKSYMHNGYFKSLKEVVHFYNTRDVLPRCTNPLDTQAGSCWPAPEVSANVDNTVGRLGLSEQEEDAIVAFLKTLTDGHMHVAAPGDAIGASIGANPPRHSP